MTFMQPFRKCGNWRRLMDGIFRNFSSSLNVLVLNMPYPKRLAAASPKPPSIIIATKKLIIIKIYSLSSLEEATRTQCGAGSCFFSFFLKKKHLYKKNVFLRRKVWSERQRGVQVIFISCFLWDVLTDNCCVGRIHIVN